MAGGMLSARRRGPRPPPAAQRPGRSRYFSALLLELFVDHLRELTRRHHARDEAPVDEHRRRAVDARLLAGLHVGLDRGGLLAGVEAAVEGLGVEAEPGRLGLEGVDRQRGLV